MTENRPRVTVAEHRAADGTLLSRVPQLEGLHHGLVQFFNDDGTPMFDAVYSHGLQHGTMKLYAGGRLQASREFKTGVLEGETCCYDGSGALLSLLPFRNGGIEGEAVFMRNGKVARRAHYRRGKMDGLCQDFDELAHRTQVATYKDDLLHGPSASFWPNGRRKEERLYKAGVMHGEVRRFPMEAVTGTAPSLAARVGGGIEKWLGG